MSDRGRDRWVLIVAACVAMTLPWVASRHLDSRIDNGLIPAMEARLGVPVEISTVEATLSGAVRMNKVSIGRLFAADAIEGSVSLRTLLRGDLRADEIRVVRPRLRVRARAPEGAATLDSDLHDLIRRAARRTGMRRTSAKTARPRRIIVTGGALRVDLIGRGTVRANDVELRPQHGGVRLIAGSTTVDLKHAGVRMRGQFERAAADLGVPGLTAARLLAVAGDVRLTPDRGTAAQLTDVSMGYRLAPAQGLRFSARINRPGRDPRVTARSTAADPRRIVIEATEAPLGPLAPLVPAAIGVDDASATGQATVRWGGDRLSIELEADVSGLIVDDRRVAKQKIPVDAQISGRAELYGRRIAINDLSVTRNGVSVQLDGHLLRGDSGGPLRGRLAIQLPRSPCADTLSAIPPPLRAELAGMRTMGTVAARVELRFDREGEGTTNLTSEIDVTRCKVLAEPTSADARSLRSAFEHTFPDGSRARVGELPGSYLALRYMPAHLVGAFVSGEDARFFHHNGFDQRQIERSLGINVQAGSFVRGGSTISQQLIKNVFLSRRRTLARKLQEAVLTWRLEALLNKRLIIERYLNIIELGPGVFGVEAAAQHWFGKSARRLGLAESAFLAALTPAPTTISRRVRAHGGIDPATRDRIDIVLGSMRRNRFIDSAAMRRARARALHIRAPKLAIRP